MSRTTDDATDAQDRQVRFMHELAAREVDAVNIRGAGRYVMADLPDVCDEFEQADSVAGEFRYERVGAEYFEADDTDRTAVSFAPEVSGE